MKRFLAACSVALTACTFGSAQESVRLVKGIEWAGRGTWLRAEFHTHTGFSDGSNSVDDVATAAVQNGCDVLAITDHSDGELKGGTPEYVQAIKDARAKNPGLVLMTAMEWNVPPGKGQEHATVLFPSQMESSATLLAFKDKFDDENKEGENPELALAAFDALTPKSGPAPVMFFNHPSRRPGSTSAPELTLPALKKKAPGIVIGFEGAPGHQKAARLGAYGDQTRLIDRWDKFVAEPGGVWDRWLRDGLDVWGAIASTDYHSIREEFLPCQFATTWVYAPDRTGDGVLRALRAGSFFAEHGHIVTEAELEVKIDAQARSFHAGETGSVVTGTKGQAVLRIKVPPTDYLGGENRIDSVELIVSTKTSTEVRFSGPPGATEAFNVPLTVPAGGLIVRARGRRNLPDGSALMFYTNPVRINAR